jgi:hypothetical protein
MDKDLEATLTPEELEAINGDAGDEENQIMRKPAAGEDDSQDDDDGDDASDEGSEEDGDSAPVEGEGAKPADDDGATEEVAEPEPIAKQAAPYTAPLPSDYDDQIKAIKDEDAALRQKFKDGEIDIDERDAGLAALSEKRESLVIQRAKAEIAQEMTQQSAQRQWETTVATFLSGAAKEEGGFDYRKDDGKRADLDQFLKILADKPENADKSMDWFLQEAHKRVKALHGVAPAPKRETVEEAVAKRRAPVSAMPKNLSQVPGSDGPGDVDGEFADIESLEGLEYEAALARLTPAQKEKFLKGS